jgi:alpha-ketoglutarate-dependent taurine dioxygenase
MIEAAEIAAVASPARYTKIDVRPIPGPIGAEMRCGDLNSLSDDVVEQIRRAWSDHLVLLFSGQPLEGEQLVAVK